MATSQVRKARTTTSAKTLSTRLEDVQRCGKDIRYLCPSNVVWVEVFGGVCCGWNLRDKLREISSIKCQKEKFSDSLYGFCLRLCFGQQKIRTQKRTGRSAEVFRRMKVRWSSLSQNSPSTFSLRDESEVRIYANSLKLHLFLEEIVTIFRVHMEKKFRTVFLSSHRNFCSPHCNLFHWEEIYSIQKKIEYFCHFCNHFCAVGSIFGETVSCRRYGCACCHRYTWNEYTNC